MPVEHLIGYCLSCHRAHTEQEVNLTRGGLLRCKRSRALVDRFTTPVPLENEAEPVTREAIRIAIEDIAFHAGIDRLRNRQALDEIVSKICQMVAESEQAR